MSQTATGLPEGYLWRAAGSPLRVIVHCQAAERLSLEALRRADRDDTGSAGGLLLGARPAGGIGAIAVEDVEPLPWPYAQAANHRRDFEQALARHAPGGDEKPVVGFYRTHSQDELFLNAADLALIKAYFPDPSSLFLLLKAGADGTLVTRFFFRQDGQWKSGDATPGWPFGQPLYSGTAAGPPPLPTAPAAPASPMGRPAPASPVGRSAPAPRALPEAPPATFAMPEMRPAGPRRATALLWMLAALAAAGLSAVYLGGGRWRTWLPQGGGAAAAPQLGLRVEKRGNDVVLHWDRVSPPVINARRAVLHVQDGPYQSPYEVDPEQLRTGSVYYTPLSGDVRFRLEVIDGAGRPVVESVRVLAGAGAPPVSPWMVSGDTVPESMRLSEPPRRETAGTRDTASRAAPPAPVLRFSPPAAAAVPAPVPLEAPPAVDQVHPRPLSNDASLAAQVILRPASPPPAPAQPAQAAAGDPPVVGTVSYTEPRATRQVQPLLPSNLRGVLRGSADLTVRVFVDERGGVTRAELVEKTGSAVWTIAVEPALAAARGWRFQPARRDGRPVPSSALVTFRFNR